MSSSHYDRSETLSSQSGSIPIIEERLVAAQNHDRDKNLRVHKPSSPPQSSSNVTTENTGTVSDRTVPDGDPSRHPRASYSHIYTPAPPLATSRYNRQLLIPSISLTGHQRIAASKILIIGLGGLGSPASLYLAGAGVGTLGLMDDDKVEITNLHRQIVHNEASVRDGLGKVESAVRACRALNSEIEVVGYDMRCDVTVQGAGERLFGIVEDYDVVLDCTDNPATRYLISDVCVLLGKVLVSGAAQRLEGQLCLLNYPVSQVVEGQNDKREDDRGSMEARGPCYRCVFPTPPSPEMVKGCGEIGILGPVVGTIGTLMASEALRFVVKGVEVGRKPSMLLYNAWSADPRGMFRSISLRGRRKDCVACGDDDVLQEKGKTRITKNEVMEGDWNYVRFCGVVEDVKLLRSDERVLASDFLTRLNEVSAIDRRESKCDWSRLVVVDVREAHETELGPKIHGSINIPLSKILRQDGTVSEINDLLRDRNAGAIVFVCQQGNDSQIAAKRFIDFRKDDIKKVEDSDSETIFIGDIVGGFAAVKKVFTGD